jgi:hypothetical protein
VEKADIAGLVEDVRHFIEEKTSRRILKSIAVKNKANSVIATNQYKVNDIGEERRKEHDCKGGAKPVKRKRTNNNPLNSDKTKNQKEKPKKILHGYADI